MNIEINNRTIRISDKIDKLPKEFVDFAIEHRGYNGEYYWDRTYVNAKIEIPYRLEKIELIDRMWSWMDRKRALSLKFVFTSPNRFYISGTMSNEEKDAYCYEYGFIKYDRYYTNLAEGEYIYSALVDIELKYAFPFNINSLIKYQ